MRNLYGIVKISKEIKEEGKNTEEHINYYKLKNNLYGLEIERKNNENNKSIEKTNIKNITKDEEKINNILNMLITKEVMPNSEDIIEDLLKQHA